MLINTSSFQNHYRSLYIKELISYDVNFIEYNRRVVQSYISLMVRRPETSLGLVDSLVIYYAINKIRETCIYEGQLASIKPEYILSLIHSYTDSMLISMFTYLGSIKADKFILNILDGFIRNNSQYLTQLSVVRIEKILAIHKKICGGNL